jgi:hypothetical protein
MSLLLVDLCRGCNLLTANCVVACPCPADSRLFAGVHFKSANEDGLKLGRLAAGKVFDRIKPLPASKAGSPAAAGSGAEQVRPATGRRMMA